MITVPIRWRRNYVVQQGYMCEFLGLFADAREADAGGDAQMFASAIAVFVNRIENHNSLECGAFGSRNCLLFECS